MGRHRTVGVQKPAILSCRVTREKKEAFINQAKRDRQKPSHVLEALVDLYLGGYPR